jgi:hypothetical protein
MNSANSSPGMSRSADRRNRVPPFSSAMQQSQNATSKLGEENCSTRLSGPAPRRSRWLRTMLATPPSVTTTPFGLPVDPEV